MERKGASYKITEKRDAQDANAHAQQPHSSGFNFGKSGLNLADSGFKLAPGESPPGPYAEGIVNLMRENHWSANPQANHPRDLDSLMVRTAGDIRKLTKRPSD